MIAIGPVLEFLPRGFVPLDVWQTRDAMMPTDAAVLHGAGFPSDPKVTESPGRGNRRPDRIETYGLRWQFGRLERQQEICFTVHHI